MERVDLFALSDLATPWCVHVVATLGVADHLVNGPADVGDLAARVSCDADSLKRVLRHLVDKGIFAEPQPGQFALNEAARGLLEPGIRLGLDLRGIGGRMALAWGGLLASVETGQAAFPAVFGRSFWEDLDAHPEVAASFDALMGAVGHGVPDPEVLIRGDWADVRTVVDVGGGTGAQLAEILKAHLSARGVLVDLPGTVARSREVFQQAGVAERTTTIGQSFFDPLPTGGDVYLLKNLLADWPDQEAKTVLRRCAEAARPHGRVVVLGGVSPDDPYGPPPDLLMLVLVGGKERTLTEFRQLAESAGLIVEAAGPLASGRFAVECRPSDR